MNGISVTQLNNYGLFDKPSGKLAATTLGNYFLVLLKWPLGLLVYNTQNSV
jgi:hypothetical protein